MGQFLQPFANGAMRECYRTYVVVPIPCEDDLLNLFPVVV